MQEKSVLTGHLSELKQKIENGLEELKSSKELYEFKSEYLEGKKSKISGLMKEMKNIAPEERANYGKSVNELKEWAAWPLPESGRGDERARAAEEI